MINLSACQAVIVGNIHGYKYGPFVDEIEGRGGGLEGDHGGEMISDNCSARMDPHCKGR